MEQKVTEFYKLAKIMVAQSTISLLFFSNGNCCIGGSLAGWAWWELPYDAATDKTRHFIMSRKFIDILSCRAQSFPACYGFYISL